MLHRSNGHGERGSVLPLTLIVLAVLITLAMMLSTMARSQVKDALLLKQQWDAEVSIHNATQKIIWILLTGEIGAREVKVNNKTWAIDGTAVVVKGVNVRIQDIAGLMSLGYYQEEEFRLLLEKITNPLIAQQLAAELGDWIDPDDFVRYKGLERDGYDAIGLHGFPRNDHLRSLDELLFLPGMTKEIYNGNKRSGAPGLRDLLVPGGMGWFNAATASVVVLRSYLHISVADAKKIIAARQLGDWGKFREMVNKGEKYFEMPPDTPGVEYQMIGQFGKWKGRMQIRLFPFKDPPYDILQWYYPDYDRE